MRGLRVGGTGNMLTYWMAVTASRRASRRAMAGLQVADAPSCARRRSYGATAASACSMRPAETGLKPRAPKRPLSWTSRSSPMVPMSSLSQSSTAAWSLLPSSPAAWTSSHDRRSGAAAPADSRSRGSPGPSARIRTSGRPRSSSYELSWRLCCLVLHLLHQCVLR